MVKHYFRLNSYCDAIPIEHGDSEAEVFERVKRGLGNIREIGIESDMTASEKNFIKKQIMAAYVNENGSKYDWRTVLPAQNLQQALGARFGGNWLVIVCESDEFCQFKMSTATKWYWVEYNEFDWRITGY